MFLIRNISVGVKKRGDTNQAEIIFVYSPALGYYGFTSRRYKLKPLPIAPLPRDENMEMSTG